MQIALKREEPVVAKEVMDERNQPLNFETVMEIFGDELPKAFEAVRTRFRWDVEFPWEPPSESRQSKEEVTNILNNTVEMATSELVSRTKMIREKIAQFEDKGIKIVYEPKDMNIGIAKNPNWQQDVLFPKLPKDLSEAFEINLVSDRQVFGASFLQEYNKKSVRGVITTVKVVPDIDLVLPKGFPRNENSLKTFGAIITSNQKSSTNSAFRAPQQKIKEAIDNIVSTVGISGDNHPPYYSDWGELEIYVKTGFYADEATDFKIGDPSTFVVTSKLFQREFESFAKALETYSTLFQDMQVNLTGLENESIKSFITGPGMSIWVGSKFFDRMSGTYEKHSSVQKLLNNLFGKITWSKITGPDGRPSMRHQDNPYIREGRLIGDLVVWLEEAVKTNATVGDFVAEAKKLLSTFGGRVEDDSPEHLTENFFGRFSEEEIRRVLKC